MALTNLTRAEAKGPGSIEIYLPDRADFGTYFASSTLSTASSAVLTAEWDFNFRLSDYCDVLTFYRAPRQSFSGKGATKHSTGARSLPHGPLQGRSGADDGERPMGVAEDGMQLP